VLTVNGKVELTVTAPVAPEIVTFDPATIEVTPVLVTFPFRYANPLEYVVVAPLYTNPFVSTFNVPAARDGSRRAELKVEEAVENNPFRNPIVVDVALYEVAEVNGNEALELRVVCRSTPPKAIVPKNPLVEEAYVEENKVEEALVKVCRAVQVLALAMLRDRVLFVPPI